MKSIRLTLREPDDSWHEFLIEVTADGAGVDIRRIEDARCDADRSVPVDVSNEHCPLCLRQPDEDCETNGQTLVLSVEFADA